MKIRALLLVVIFSTAALLGFSLLTGALRGQTCGTGTTPFVVGRLANTGQYITYVDTDVNQNGVLWAIGSSGLVTTGGCGNPFVIGFPPNGQSLQAVASAPDGSAWVTTVGNQIYHMPSPVNCVIQPWTPYPGAAHDIAVTSDGTVWVIGTNGTGGGYHIYYWNGSSWSGVAGGGVRIAAAPGGALNDTKQPWVVNSSHQIFHRNPDGTWQGYPGLAYDIGIDRYTGNPWVVGTLDDGGGFELFYWNGSAWIGNPIPTGGATISTGFYNCLPNAVFVDANGDVNTVTLTPF